MTAPTDGSIRHANNIALWLVEGLGVEGWFKKEKKLWGRKVADVSFKGSGLFRNIKKIEEAVRGQLIKKHFFSLEEMS